VLQEPGRDGVSDPTVQKPTAVALKRTLLAFPCGGLGATAVFVVYSMLQGPDVLAIAGLVVTSCLGTLLVVRIFTYLIRLALLDLAEALVLEGRLKSEDAAMFIVDVRRAIERRDPGRRVA
jgi:hypothetical protein